MNSHGGFSFLKLLARCFAYSYFKLTTRLWCIHRSLEQMYTCTTGQAYKMNTLLHDISLPLFDEFSFDWTLTVSVELFFFLQI